MYTYIYIYVYIYTYREIDIMHMYNILRLWILDLDFSIEHKIQNEDATNIKSLEYINGGLGQHKACEVPHGLLHMAFALKMGHVSGDFAPMVENGEDYCWGQYFVITR